MVLDYVLAGALVFGVNLLPAFGPPTWAVLVFLRLSSDLAAVPLVLVGALAAALGRFVLANGAHHFRRYMSAERIESLAAAQEVLSGSRRRAAAGLGLFALSPVPSAQLFVAAGLMTVPLVPLTAAFFAGRLVSYSIYVAGASAAKHTFGTVILDSLRSPLGIVLQVAMLAALVALVRIDWTTIIRRRAARRTAAKSR
jgi:membrane protein YqaA with SNARE-associated domain